MGKGRWGIVARRTRSSPVGGKRETGIVPATPPQPRSRSYLRGMRALLPLLAASLAACGGRGDDFAPLAFMMHPPQGRFVQVSSTDTTGGNRDRLELRAGERAVLLDRPGPGVIQRIWITVASRSPDYLRRMTLEMYWDDETEPSVRVPLGDFFGNGFDKRHYTALPMGESSGGFYAYLPMPYHTRARLEILNETGLPVDAFYYQIGLVEPDRLAADVPTFHASWRRTRRTSAATPHEAVAAQGRGVFVGLSLNAESYGDNLWFLEGDETYEVDGEIRGRGTGTEDYFNGGWYFNEGPFAAPFHGVVLKDETRGRIAAYRWHLTDPVRFHDSLRITLEHGHANEEVADYATVAYWYQREPHRPLPQLPEPLARRVLGVKIAPGALLLDSLANEVVRGRRTLAFPVPRPDRYRVLAYPVGGPGGGRAAFVLTGGGRRTVALHAADSATVLEAVALGDVRAVDSVRLAVVGDGVTLPAGVELRPVYAWATDWNVVGPFPNPRAPGTELSPALDSVYGPERDPSLDARYPGPGGTALRWIRAHAGEDGQVRLNPLFNPDDWVVAYAQAFLFAPDARDVTLLFGADDAHVLWVNGERVSSRQGRHISQPDDLSAIVRLRAGWNRVLLKVADLDGGWAFQMRAADPDGVLRWNSAPR